MASLIRKVPFVRNALDNMETVITFVTDGAKREDILSYAQTQKLDSSKRHKLVKLCQTRFVERHVAVERFCEQLSAIVLALRAISTWDESRSSSKAAMFLHTISMTEFLVGVFVAEKLAGILRPLALALQEKGADLVKALDLINAVRTALHQLRSESEEEFAPVMARVEAAAEEMGVEVAKPRLVDRSSYRANAGGSEVSIEGYYRLNAFIPAVDHVLQDVDLRFGKHMQLVAGLSTLVPKRIATVGADWKRLQPSCQLYQELIGDITQSQVQAELSVWAAMWKDREDAPVTAIAALNACPASVFPGLHTLLRVLAVLPVSTAEAERMFSKVARTLTALRATMTEDRLESLVLIQAHRDQLPDIAKIVDRFASEGTRRLNFKTH